jgi:general secretion pathway protein D
MNLYDLQRIGQFLFLSVAVAMFLSLTGCTASRQSFDKGVSLEQQGHFEEAMLRYGEALNTEPDAAEYRIRFLAARTAAARARAKRGDESLAAADYPTALTEYQAASLLEPGIKRYAEQAALAARLMNAQTAWQEGIEFERLKKTGEAARAFATALELDPKSPRYLAAAERVAALRKSPLKRYELQLRSNSRFTLKFKEARLKEVFAVVSQLSGISFIFDDSVKDVPVSINLNNATFDQAFELLTGMNRLGSKVLNEQNIMIYAKTPEKIKQYEEMVVRIYQLQYMDAKKAINLVRNILQVRKLQVNEESNTLVLRDTLEVANVVEKILASNDFPEPEVILDVEVVEVNNKKTQDLGLLLSNYAVALAGFTPAGKMLSPTLYSSTDTPTPMDVTQLLKAFSIRGFGGYVTVPNAQYNIGKTLAKGNILSNPKIRVRNKEKAKFNVGQRVPVQTTTTTGTIASTNVQYADVGIKLNAEPSIQLSNEVVVKLALEVSSVIGKETSKTDNTTLLTIGTRNLDTVLSLKDGETVIIGGLIQNSDTDSTAKIFLLGDLPLLGPLLSNNSETKEKNELLLAITPRLVRGVAVHSPSQTIFESGQEDEPALARPYAAFMQPPEYEEAVKPQLPQK